MILAPLGMTIFAVLHWEDTGKHFVRMCVSIAILTAGFLVLGAFEGHPPTMHRCLKCLTAPQ